MCLFFFIYHEGAVRSSEPWKRFCIFPSNDFQRQNVFTPDPNENEKKEGWKSAKCSLVNVSIHSSHRESKNLHCLCISVERHQGSCKSTLVFKVILSSFLKKNEDFLLSEAQIIILRGPAPRPCAVFAHHLCSPTRGDQQTLLHEHNDLISYSGHFTVPITSNMNNVVIRTISMQQLS